MKDNRHLLTLLLLAALAAGCSESALPTSALEADGGLTSPYTVAAAAKPSPHVHSGAIIEQGQDRGRAFFYNPDEQLLALISSNSVLCAPGTLVLANYQLVFTPAGALHFLIRAPEQYAWVVESVTQADYEAFLTNSCAFLAGVTPIAHGRVRVQEVDNDIYGGLEGGGAPGANTFAIMAHGELELAGGGTARLLCHTRYQILPDGTFRELVVRAPQLQ